jgi:hypothetical protein
MPRRHTEQWSSLRVSSGLCPLSSQPRFSCSYARVAQPLCYAITRSTRLASHVSIYLFNYDSAGDAIALVRLHKPSVVYCSKVDLRDVRKRARSAKLRVLQTQVLAQSRRQKTTLLTPPRMHRYVGIRGRNSLITWGSLRFSGECAIRGPWEALVTRS